MYFQAPHECLVSEEASRGGAAPGTDSKACFASSGTLRARAESNRKPRTDSVPLRARRVLSHSTRGGGKGHVDLPEEKQDTQI